MRILMLNNEFPPLGGGTGTVNQALLRRFAHLPGLEIDLVTAALGRRAERERFAERIWLHKVPVDNKNIHHSSNRELLTYAARALAQGLRLQRQRRYDLCFAWSAVPAGGVALALRRLAGLPYLVRVCGPDIPGFERRYGPLYPALTPAIRAVWRGAAAVVAKCAAEAEMIAAVDPGVAVTLVPNGVELDAFAPAHDAAGTAPAEPLRAVCVARLIERKGQQHLIAAVRRLADAGVAVAVELVGTGDAEEELRALARRLAVADRVRFAGYVPRERIAERYAAADVFVLPSYNEGMSVATLEAMAAGLPTLVTRTGGAAELVAEGASGLMFDWADVAGLAAHLRRLAEDRALARHMGQAARARAALFTWDSAAVQYLEMFERLAAPERALVHTGGDSSGV
jgi:glycosyltransferase involved in cell wall biosynthesis